VIATWISEFWLGMEFADLIGATEQQIQHRAALDAVEYLLEQLDARTGKAAPAAQAKASGAQRPRKAAARKKRK